MRLSRLAMILMPLVVCRACTFPQSNDNTGCEPDGGPSGPYGGGYGYGGGGGYATPCSDIGGTCVTSLSGPPPQCPPATIPYGSAYYCNALAGVGVCCLPNVWGFPDASSPCSQTGGTCVFSSSGPPACPPDTRFDQGSICYPASGACCLPVDGGAEQKADAGEDGGVEDGGEDATEDAASDGMGEDAGPD